MATQIRAPEKEELLGGERWLPAADVIEKKDKFLITLELPGVNMNDIDVSVADGMLIIRGQKQPEEEIEQGDYFLSERHFGRFFRAVELPPGTDSNGIQATFDNGVLALEAIKSPEVTAEPTKIPIKTTIEARR